MGFTRNWDSSCPRVWDSWETDGIKWVIQDLAPEDDNTALEILVNHFAVLSHNEIEDTKIRRLIMSPFSDFSEDAESVNSIVKLWKKFLSQRMSLGCYTEIEGKKTLVALNVCIVENVEEKLPADEEDVTMGLTYLNCTWRRVENVLNAMEYVESKCNTFEYLGVDRLLNALGLVVKPKFRGHKFWRLAAANDVEINDFYKSLEMGDFNAKIGQILKDEYLITKKYGYGQKKEENRG
ncbi:uncharacterized protein LOC113392723 [Vanessa tameamea]|uniref:Uncharacterized protein LOC113392723 n=1 Tax=Vanessa tameamea TaxID=334116 RepID=A0ABM4AZX3_VANTA